VLRRHDEIKALKDELYKRTRAEEEIGQAPIFEEMNGSSANFGSTGDVEKVVPTDSYGAFTGETGTGKELVGVQFTSDRIGQHDLVSVNAQRFQHPGCLRMFGSRKHGFSDTLPSSSPVLKTANP